MTAFWLACFIYWMFRWKDQGDLPSAAAAGASLGLAALTKSTTYVFAFPFLVWFGILLLKRYRAGAAGLMALAAMLFLLLNLGSYVREFELFGNPLGITRDPMVQGYYSNDIFSPAELASNLVRNTAIHLGTPVGRVNAYLERAVASLHDLIHISENDRRTTWIHTQFHIRLLSFFEYTDGNFLHVVLIVISGLVAAVQTRRQKRPDLLRRLPADRLCGLLVVSQVAALERPPATAPVRFVCARPRKVGRRHPAALDRDRARGAAAGGCPAVGFPESVAAPDRKREHPDGG